MFKKHYRISSYHKIFWEKNEKEEIENSGVCMVHKLCFKWNNIQWYFIEISPNFIYIIQLSNLIKKKKIKIQNWLFNFQPFSFQSSNFQICYFSPLTFNCLQFGILLDLSYFVVKWTTSFWLLKKKKFKIKRKKKLLLKKKKKKTFRGTMLFPLLEIKTKEHDGHPNP